MTASASLEKPTSSLVGILRDRALELPDKRAYTFLADGEGEAGWLTYAELDLRARAIAAALSRVAAPGDRALLLFPPGLDFIAAFFGCLYAGVVAVPAYPPHPRRDSPRLRAIALDAAPRVVLTTAALAAASAAGVARAPELTGALWLAADELTEAGGWSGRDPAPDDLAFLQYTSGSTSLPKGVMVTHANLLHNERMIRAAFAQDEGSVVVGWLPLYHDMGLIGNVLQPLYCGGSCVLMSPVAFLQRPRRWLEAISRYRATTSGGPNFAYDLCVRRVPAEEREGLDLSSWRVAYSGAEPVRAETLERFAAAFAGNGFRAASFYPCYGLAEATLFVSGGRPGSGFHAEELDAAALDRHEAAPAAEPAAARRLVACGHAWEGQRIAVADPETGAGLPPGRIGEIWVSGPSVARGYWLRPEQTARDFGAVLAGEPAGERFLRTGDLGFLTDGGELFVTGRLKDLVILRGRNHYPQDLELTAERAHPGLRAAGAAAFAVDLDGEERLVLVCEVERRPGTEAEEIAAVVRRAIAEEHEVQAERVVLVRTGTIPKTSSGKIQRHACRAAFLDGTLEVVGESALARGGGPAVEVPAVGVVDTGDPAERRAVVLADLQERAARLLGDRPDPSRPLTELGLDSISAVELAAGVEEAYGVPVPLAGLIEGASLEALAEAVVAGAAEDAGTPPPLVRLPEEARQGPLPLTVGQRALWFLERLAPESQAYGIAGAGRLPAGVDAEVLRGALQALVDRHAALRTVFGEGADGPWMRVATPGTAAVDFRVVPAGEWDAAAVREAAFRRFDLQRGPLFRAVLFRGEGAGDVLALAVHHLVADLWSLAVMLRDLGAAHDALSTGRPPLPPADGLEMGDFAAWQASGWMERQEGFWRRSLAGAPELELPADRETGRTGVVARSARIGAEDARAWGGRHGATLFMTLLAGFQALLGRRGGQEDFAVGAPMAGRTAPGLLEVVGYFVNTVPLRADLSGDPTGAGLLERARGTALGAFANQDFPYAWMVERLGAPRLRAVLALQKAPAPELEPLAGFALGEAGARLRIGGLEVESLPLEPPAAQFDLTLLAAEREGEIRFSLQADAARLDGVTVELMLGHFLRLLGGMAAAPERPVSGIDLLGEEERLQILGVNRTAAAVPALPVHRQVLERAAAAPEALAVAGGGSEITYGELERRAARLAAHLRDLGVGPESLVGICAPRSPGLAVGALAVLAAGGAYLPLDPGYPRERLEMLLDDAGVEVVLAGAGVELPGRRVVRLEGEPEGGGAAAVATDDPLRLAYVIYTSGSTGRPKGVAVPHGGLANLVAWHLRTYGLTAADRATLIASPGFDAAVWEMWPGLAAGASLHVPDEETRSSPERLLAWLAAERITVCFLPTPLAEAVLALAPPPGLALRALLTGGDRLRAAPPAGLPFRLINHYGPTESSVVATAGEVAPDAAGSAAAPPSLGGPIANTRIYLLDRGLMPVPAGVPGELCLAGAGLARGYLGRPDLTAERFLPDPFAEEPGSRLYRAGDLMRLTGDGRELLEFLGRIDRQVKVRGVRIEPGEIEAALLALPGVREAAVDLRDLAGGPGLAAWVAGDGLQAAELRRALRARLPEAMVPAAFAVLPALPLTPHGKIDRAALPAPRGEEAEGAETARPSRTALEEVVAGVWADVLGLAPESIGPRDGFFDLGGHSLVATRVTSRLREAFGVELPLRALFERPTLAATAEALAALLEAGGAPAPPLAPRAHASPPRLSFGQERLWLLQRLDPRSAAYNIAASLRLPAGVTAGGLALALGGLVRRHETLRTVFRPGPEGWPVQAIQPPAPFPLAEVDLSSLADPGAAFRELAAAEARRPFDLAEGPLVRGLLARLAEGERRLFLCLHHAVADGWSVEVLARELAARLEGAEPPPLPVRYADFAVWQRERLAGPLLDSQLAFWRQRLAGGPESSELPADRARPAGRRGAGAVARLPLPGLAGPLATLGRSRGATLFMTLLAGFQAVQSRLTGQTDLVTGTPVASRARAELEELIGFFVNTLALRTDLSGEPGFGDLLGRVRETALGAYAHQDLPFEILVGELAPERSAARHPLFQVLLLLQRRPGPEIEEVHTGTAKLDLTLGFDQGPEGLAVWAEHDLDLFDASTVERLLGNLKTFLTAAVAAPERPFSELPLLTPEEQAQLAAWDGETRHGHPTGTLHGLFEEQARRTPGALALVAGEERLTYADLDRRSAGLAARLRALGVGPEVPVAVFLERTADLVVALLGVLRAGGFSVPLDPRYPADRLSFLLEDSGARLALVGPSTRERLPAGAEPVLVDGEGFAPAGPLPAPEPGSLAYLIYTSGSTGRPKAVAIEHRSAVLLVHWARDRFGDDLRGLLAPTSITFDLSIFELFAPLASGGTVILLPDALAVAGLALPAGIEPRLLNTVPSAAAELVRLGALPASVRTVCLAGEALPAALAAALYATGTVERVFNLYGPSEDTTYSTVALVERGSGRPSIGRPLPGTRAFVVDSQLHRLPVEAAGELCLAGEGLARGYLGRPELTAERFIPDPFAAEPGARMYRTGDRVRRLADGSLDFLGRLDQQVKIRGFRIEPGEIEAVLSGLPGVREAAVLVQDGPGGKRLVACVAGSAREPGLTARLREGLARRLPEHMVPAVWVEMETLPRNPNGKLDRRELSRRLPESVAEPAGGEAPRTPVEELLAGIFAEVLERPRVGRGESFFHLGGHSLLATRVVSRVREALGVELPLRALFEDPTVAALAERIGPLHREPAPPLRRAARTGSLPLSFAQERLWFLDQLAPGDTAYNLPAAVRLSGRLDVPALAASLGEIARRHEALRTRFMAAAGGAAQVVDPPAGVPLPLLDLAALPPERREPAARAALAAAATAPFDLGRGPLLRALLLRLGDDDHALGITLHHIVADGWSLGVLVTELSALYAAGVAGRPSPLPELPVQYADYAAWQRSWLAGGVLERQLAWWRERLAGAPQLLELPADRPRPPARSNRGGWLTAALPGPLADGLRRTARQEGGTLFMALLAGFQALLARLTGQEDLLVGSPVANRTRTEVEGLIGFFVNTLVLRAEMGGTPGFGALLGRARETALGAYAHQDLPFERLVEELAPERDLSRSPLIQVLLVLQNAPLRPLDLPGLRLQPVDLPGGAPKLDLTLTFTEGTAGDAGLGLLVEHDAALFDASTVERLLGNLKTFLTAAVAAPERPFSELPLLTPEEQAQLAAWDDEARHSHPTGTLHGLFEEQARRTPGALALVAGEERLTYADLDRRSAGLAARLRALGVGPEVPVAVFLERTADLVVALLGVLRAGGFSVPLDPRYPADRLSFLLEDSGARLALVGPSTRERLPAGPVPVLVDGEEGSAPAGPLPAPEPGNLAYLIYTSGSTGRPKAVAIEHRSAVLLVHWARGLFGDDLRGLLAPTSITFDLSIFELFAPLASGGTVILLPDALAVAGLALPAGVEPRLLNTVPSAAAELVRLGALPAPVRTVCLAGEALPAALAAALYATGTVERVFNLYGPSEDTTYSTVALVERGSDRPSIGRPLPGTRAFVVDSQLHRLPVGAAGELCLAGEGLARGYLGRPELTAERFIPDPFAAEPGARMYRTGDRVRRLADGSLDFLGRLDQQVKIRGFRIEPGEIEAVLSGLPEVCEAAVLVQDGPGGKRLVACVAGSAREPGLTARLRESLARRLPEHMVPAVWVEMESLPRNPNGKLDRRELSRRLPEAVEEPAGGEAPRTPVEELLAGIFAEVLERPRVGRGESFFHLGGHSLLATRVVSRVREALGVELPVRALFEEPTVAALAAGIERARGAALPPVERTARDGELPLSFAQERLWFLDQLAPGSAAYNIPGAVALTGELRPAALAGALGAVVARHEALRTRFAARGGRPVQIVTPPAPLPLPVIDLRALPEEPRENEAVRLAGEEARAPFDLAAGPLLRARLLRQGETDWTCLLTQHHIASDGWSLSVLLAEIAALYGAAAEGRPSPLPELPVRYADYAVWQRRWLTGEVLAGELAWWRGQLAGAPTVLELPTDRPRPAVAGLRGGRERVELPREPVERLGRRHGATLYMTLLAGFGSLLSRWADQDELLVGSPVAGRPRRELEGLIGFFVNSLVQRIDVTGEPSFGELLGRVREVSLASLAHQELPFERLVEDLAPERDLGRSPLFQVMLAVQAAPLELSAPGLALRGLPVDSGTAKLDLSVELAPEGEGIAGWIEYRADLFEPATARRLGNQLAVLLAAAAAAPETPVWALPLLSAAEREQMLAGWSRSAGPWAAPGSVQSLFVEQARRTPGADALVAGDRRIRYAELERLSGALARRLRRLGVGPEVRVGLSAERSPELVVGILGILRAGGVLVPLDPAHPAERLSLLLADAGLAAVLAQPSLRDRLPADGPPVLPLEVSEEGPELPFHDPELPAGALAYVIYTSGSTGRPKGVGVSHANAIPMLRWSREWFGLAPGRRVLQSLSYAFDFGLWEILTAVVSGAALHIPPVEETGDPVAYGRRALAGGIDTVHATPSFFRAVAESGARLEGLRVLHLGGEALTRAQVARLAAAVGPETELYNGYGPTEATVNSLIFPIGRPGAPRGGELGERVPIGRPSADNAAYVVDRRGEPVPVGVPGELWVGGPGVARGYLGRPELTAEKFIPDAFSGEAGGRLYRTGDLVRWLPSGEVEFLGRVDHQVKIRGFRIEPGEIEAALRRHPGVREAVVAAREVPSVGGQAVLVAWVETAEETSGLREHLRALLPESMIPSYFVRVAELPLTATGKVNRKALPEPAIEAVQTQEAPRTPVEELLAGIFAEVLGLERVGTGQSFFELGGHSLLAAQVVARVRDAFGVELPVRALFEEPTVAALAAGIEHARGAGLTAALPPVERVERDGELPLSFAQERLWFLDQLAPGSAAYNIPGAVALTGDLRPEALAGALGAVVARHEALRTRFAAREGRPVQIVAPPAPLPLPVIDLRALPEEPRESEAGRLAVEEARAPFDLASGPLLRARLLRRGETDWTCLLTQHHIASDGWSLSLLLAEIAALYGAAAEGRPSPLPEPPVRYADYAVWQRRWLTGEVLAGELAWWRGQLAGAPTVLELPTDRPRPAVAGLRGGRERVELPREPVERLGRRHGATLYMTLLAGFGSLLSRWADQDELLVGSPVAGRPRRELEGLIGFFVNSLVQRIDVTGEPPFGELLGRVREVALASLAHQELPFERLVEDLAPERDLGRSPLFQVMLAVQAAPLALSAPGLALRGLPVDSGTAKLDLSVELVPEGEGLGGWIEYRADLFEPATARRLGNQLAILLSAAAAAPETPVSALPLLSAAEREQMLADWSRSAGPWAAPGTVQALFVEQARRTPAADALVAGDRRIGYAELERLSGALARRLRRLGVGPEVRVGLSAERSPELVVGLLGILRAGGVLVPLDPAHPAERLSLLLADAGLAAVLAQPSLMDRLPADGPPVLPLEVSEEGAELPFHDPELPAEALAYVIYTSGSTGRPKGVGVSHANAVPMLRWSREWFGLAPGRRVLQGLSYAFDFGLWEILTAVVSGAALHIPSVEETGDPVAYGRRALAEGIDTVHATPSFFRAVAESGVRLEGLRVLHLGGEALTRAQVARLAAAVGPETELYNGYGPTEATVNSLIFPIGRPGLLRGGELGERIPIGRPSADNAAYVMDRRGEPVPVGVPGELWVGGPGVARGYLGRPDLTAEKFIPDAFSGEAGGRLYRTGDLVRWLSSGEVEFLGRVDHQVKIRGFRIEPGEIEAALRRHPGVREAVVAAREVPAVGGQAVLVAWVETAEETSGLREHLRALLPESMIPSYFVRIAELPLTATGKVDRKALPEPAVEASEVGEAPRTPVEELLAGIFAEVLGTGAVGREESFFHLGGHSLLAAQVVARVRDAFGVELPVRALFEEPTVAALAAEIEHARGAALPPVERIARDGELPLSFAQERLWFLDQLAPGSAAYNIPGAVALTGELRPEALAGALGAVVARHEALRTRFAARGGRPVQIVAPPAPLPLPVIDLRALPEEPRESEAGRLAGEEARAPFDLAAGPLLRARLLRRGETDWTCLLTQHHIASDGWSLGILLAEIAALYGAAAEGRPSPLPEPPVQYADYAVWQRRWLTGEVLAGELAWWRGQLAGAPAVLELPTDRPRPALAGIRGGRERVQMAGEIREGVERLGRRGGATLYMILLAACGALLARWSGQDELLVGSPVAGRPRRELEGLIGLFVNSVVQRVDITGEPTFGELLRRVREVSLASLAHQELPFERLVEVLAPERDLGRSPLFQVMLAVQAAGPELAAPGLRLRGLPVDSGTAKLDLSVELAPEGEGIAGWIEYRADLFEAATARRLGSQLAVLLAAAAAAPETPVSALPLLSAAEREQMLVDWSRSAGPWAAPGTIHALFEEQARRTPDHAAVVAEDTVLTYGELDESADRLAELIKEIMG